MKKHKRKDTAAKYRGIKRISYYLFAFWLKMTFPKKTVFESVGAAPNAPVPPARGQ